VTSVPCLGDLLQVLYCEGTADFPWASFHRKALDVVLRAAYAPALVVVRDELPLSAAAFTARLIILRVRILTAPLSRSTPHRRRAVSTPVVGAAAPAWAASPSEPNIPPYPFAGSPSISSVGCDTSTAHQLFLQMSPRRRRGHFGA